jgi:hypothetical protein
VPRNKTLKIGTQPWTSSPGNATVHGNRRTVLSGFLLNRPPSDCEIVCGAPPGSTSCRTIDTSSRRGRRTRCRKISYDAIENSNISGSAWSRLARPKSPHRSFPDSSLESGRFLASESRSKSPAQRPESGYPPWNFNEAMPVFHMTSLSYCSDTYQILLR